MSAPEAEALSVGGAWSEREGAAPPRRPSARRRNGEGSIFWWERRRRWVVRVPLPDGTRATYYCSTEAEAGRKLRIALAAARTGRLPGTNSLTLARFLTDRFLPRLTGKPSHLVRTTEIIKLHLAPSLLGPVPLAQLRPVQVEDWRNDKLAEISARTGKPYSPTTVRLMHVTLRRALAVAVRWELVDRNVAALVPLPSTADFEGTTWSAEEAGRFLDAAAHHPLEALWVLALTTGMRQGELLGLRWADVQLRERRLRVAQSMVWIHGRPTPSTPKTRRSRREIELVDVAVAALERHAVQQVAHRLRTGSRWNDLDLVFCNGLGKPLNPATLRTRAFLPLMVRARVPKIRFHDMRGTAASLLYASGADDRRVQDLLGHSSVRTTHDHYIHTRAHVQANPLQRAAVERLGMVLARVSGAGVSPSDNPSATESVTPNA